MKKLVRLLLVSLCPFLYEYNRYSNKAKGVWLECITSQKVKADSFFYFLALKKNRKWKEVVQLTKSSFQHAQNLPGKYGFLVKVSIITRHEICVHFTRDFSTTYFCTAIWIFCMCQMLKAFGCVGCNVEGCGY